MPVGRFAAGLLALLVLLPIPFAPAAPLLPVLDDKPTPQVDAGGPSAAVTALTFGADGTTLYAAGLDKVVRVWTRPRGRFALKTAYRVPVGPGNTGGVNAVALSPDGAWVAMAGRSPMRGEAGFRQLGVIVESAALSPEQNQDAGLIYVASTTNPAGGKVLRGHRGEVRALAFAPGRKGKPPLLVSAATERDGDRRFGGVRLWDVAAGKELARRTDLPVRLTRPGLAVWHTGPGATEVRVAVAWPEEDVRKPCFLRLWDPAPDADPMQRWKTDRFTQTAALIELDRGARILVGSFGPPGRVRVWHLSPDRDTEAHLGDPVDFPPRDDAHFLPVALAVVSPRYAAVVLQPAGKADFRLALIDLRELTVVANVRLAGSDTDQMPAIAASAKYVAVAATRDHAVRVYAVDDLRDGKAAPEALLAGEGLVARQVAFVDKGRGLWLSKDADARPRTGGLLFDIDKRQLRANDRVAPPADAPALGDWSLTIDRDSKGVRVRQGKKEFPPVRLKGKDEVVTTAALRPPAGGRPGVLAVAYTEIESNRTLIMLCDPANGKPYRLLVSHLHHVRGLAFSATRPLLASVADDQTLAVWGLADIGRAVGEVPGLGVGDKGKTVVVRRVEPGSAAAKAKLEAGDVIEKVGAPGAAKAVKDAAAFLLAVSARRPGTEVEVVVRGKGAIKLGVARGVDERKPLFSLFLLRTRALPEWVGWSPAGPYDYSSPAAEAHLGWHTNTGDPAAPVSYAPAREYRKDYFREGILRYLATEADLGRALDKWNKDHPTPPPRPALRPLRPDDARPTDRGGEYLVRKAVKALRVAINEDYPLDAKHVLRWRLTRADGGKVKGDDTVASGAAARDGKAWLADLADVAWRRGDYRLRVLLHAHAAGPELAAATVMLRFQPPAPTVALRRAGKAVTTSERKPLKVMDDKLTLDVALEAPAGQEVEVRFVQSLNGLAKDAPAARTRTGPGTFAQAFTLHEGLNRLAVRAVNKGALPGHEDEEAAAAEVWVSYKAPRELPPGFYGLRLDPEPEVKRLDGKTVWVVSKPSARLTGSVEAAGDLTRADWSAGAAAKSVLPARPGRTAEFTADLELKPGTVVTVRLRAKSKFSDESTTERRVVFHPPLPAAAIDPLDSPDILTNKVTLTGRVRAATDHPFDLGFRVTSAAGTAKSFKPVVDRKAGTWKVELTLSPGGNTVETVVANKWRGERAVEGPLHLRYRRPPRITTAPKEIEAVETNKVKLLLTVEGPATRPLTAVEVDGAPVRFEVGMPEARGDIRAWKVTLPEVFVHDGDRNLDRVSIRAVTDEGTSPAAVVRVVHKKLPRLARARFLRPTASDTARRPEYPVLFRVESERPLERVEIHREGTLLYRADVKKAEREGALHVLQGDALLMLKSGANRLELVAVNTDGRAPRAEVVVSYTQPAVLVSIDRVEVLGARGEVAGLLQPSYRPDGDMIFPPAPNSLVSLVGRVRWSDPKARALDDRNLKVVVTVGDCRQFPVALDRRGEGEEANVRRFQVPLVLIGAENHVKVEVPSVGQQVASRRAFSLTCAAPSAKQRLHVLVIGVDVEDGVRLKKRILDALAVDPRVRPAGAQGEFSKKPPFERCILYHVLSGEVDRARVEGQLVEIGEEITRLRSTSGWLNDVVLIYYQGEDVEVPGRKERWLKTSGNFQFPKTPAQEFAVPCHALPPVPGAQLLLLNVAGAPGARVAAADWGGDPNTGFMRYAYRPAEARTADPALLALLQEAVHKKDRLGDVIAYVNNLLSKRPAEVRPLIALDSDHAGRRISAPDR